MATPRDGRAHSADRSGSHTSRSRGPHRSSGPGAEEPWRRLAPGMLLVEPVREIIKFIPMLIVLVFAGSAGSPGLPGG